jgi:hypothetical protein
VRVRACGRHLGLDAVAGLAVDPGEEDAADHEHAHPAQVQRGVAVAHHRLPLQVDPDLRGRRLGIKPGETQSSESTQEKVWEMIGYRGRGTQR